MFGAGEGARLGIATAGKPYYDLMQCLRDLGIRREELDALGVRIAKFGMTFPLEPHFVAEFARGLETILVIEEKRSFLELQMRELLYNAPAASIDRRQAGRDTARCWFRQQAKWIPRSIADVLARYLPPRESIASANESHRGNRVAPPREDRHTHARRSAPAARTTGPRCCSKARWPRGGIGCHGMSATQGQSGRGYAFLTHMGGEGAPWIGMAPFVERKHIFQNIGDGTYFHSGSLAIEACRGGRRQHHLQDSVQRRGRHDGRPGTQRRAAGSGAHSQSSQPRACARTVVLTDDLAKYDGVSLAAQCRAARSRRTS